MIFGNSEIRTCQDTVASRILFEDECTFGTKLKFPDGGRKKNMSNWWKFGGDRFRVTYNLQDAVAVSNEGDEIENGPKEHRVSEKRRPIGHGTLLLQQFDPSLIAKFHFSFSGLQRLCAVLILLKLFGNIFYATFSLKFRCWGTLPPRSLSRIIYTHSGSQKYLDIRHKKTDN